MKSIKITQVPYINGNAEELERFMKDTERFGYTLCTSEGLNDFSKGCLKLNGNCGKNIQTDEDSFKTIVTVPINNLYQYNSLENTGVSTIEFFLPQDYQKALLFMEMNMNKWMETELNYEIY